jgi:hypothetical protein
MHAHPFLSEPQRPAQLRHHSINHHTSWLFGKTMACFTCGGPLGCESVPGSVSGSVSPKEYVTLVETRNCWRIEDRVFDPDCMPCGACGLCMTRCLTTDLRSVVGQRTRARVNAATKRLLSNFEVVIHPIGALMEEARAAITDPSVHKTVLGHWVPGAAYGTALVQIVDGAGVTWGWLVVDVTPEWLGGKSFWVTHNPRGVTVLEVVVAATALAAARLERDMVYLSYFDPGNPRLAYKARYGSVLEVWCRHTKAWVPFGGPL